MELLELLKERYSVRKYSDRPVEQEKLDKIIEAAMVAPSAKNFQPVRIYVLKSEEAIARITDVICTETDYEPSQLNIIEVKS